jgi:AmmeMemoRadiSam system protein B
MRTRPAAVAGLFYPADAATLSREIDGFLDGQPRAARAPKALIVPHAGYVYSGPVAATAYARVAPLREQIRRVVLLGPSHRVPLEGMAVPSVDAFETPLGPVALDRASIDALVAAGSATQWDAPHAGEHALEVQLPFLQAQLGAFILVPVSVGRCAPESVADLLDTLWGGDETLIVVSSDLSHFHRYDEARRIDRDTSDAILRRESTLRGEQACGCHAVNGLLLCARRRALPVQLLDLRSSGDTAGDCERVVGYASFAIHEAAPDA